MNEQSYFNIKNGLLFPFQFQILGYVLLFAGLALIVINIWASIIFILLGGAIVSAYSGIEFKKDKFREYNAFFFIRSGNWEPYRKVEKIFIKKVKKSQKFYGRANQSSTVSNYIYNAYLKFDNGKTILLYEHKNKDKLETKLKKLSDYLNAKTTDYSN